MVTGTGALDALHFDAHADEAARLAKVERLEAAVSAQPGLSTITAVLEALTKALQDSSAAVLKRAIPAAHVALRPGYRAALKWGTGPQVPEDVAAVWAACLAAMQRVSQLLSQPRPPPDGVRMLAARFLENTMLLISAEPSSTAKAPKAQHALLSAASVAKECDSIIQQMVGLIKPPGGIMLPGPVSIVTLKGLGAIAQQRPQYLGRILPTLLKLASVLTQPQEDRKRAFTASMARALKDALLCVLRCRAPQALTWHRKVAASLEALGAGEAEADLRRAERQAKRDRGQDPGEEAAAKRSRIDELVQEQAAQHEAPQQAPADEPQPQPAQAPAVHHVTPQVPLMEQLLHQCLNVTNANELFQVIAVMAALASSPEDIPTLQAFASNLPLTVLADVVIANMDHMPRREDVAGAQNASSGAGALASLMHGLSNTQPSLQQQARVSAASAAARAQQAGHSNQSPSAGQPVKQGDRSAASMGKKPAPSKLPKPAPKPIIKRQAPPKPKLKPLSPDQEAALRLGAVQRILSSEAVPAQHLRSSVLAALASRAPACDPAADMVLQHILANFRQPGSYSLALQWLYSLFVAYSQADISAQHEAAASAHVNAPQLRAALASALDDGDMAASSAGRSDQLQPSLSSPAGQQKSTQPSAALAEAPIKADQSTEMLSESAQQQPKQLAGTQGAIARIGDDNIAPVKVEQDDSSAGPQMEVSVTSAAIEVPQGTATVQDRSMSEPGSSGRDHAADLAGTLYETVLLAILEGLREQVAPDEKLIARLLIDSPALPHGGVMAFLRDVCSTGDEWATLALSSCYDIITKRPPDRLAALQVVLDAATGPDTDIRNKAVRLVANRLFLERSLQEAITDFAASKLRELLPAPKQPVPALMAGNPGSANGPVQALAASAGAGTSNGDQQGLSQQAAGEAHRVHTSAEQQQQAGTEPAPDNSSNGHAEAGKPDLQQPKVKQEPCEDDSAAGQPHQATDDLLPSSTDAHIPAEVKQEGVDQLAEPMQIDLPADKAAQSSQPAPIDVAAGGMPTSGRAGTEQSEGEAGRGTPEQAGTGDELAVVPEQAAVQMTPMSTEEAAERCELLCALCTKSPQLLRMLLEVFGKAEGDARKAISKNARLLARAVGPQAPIWIDLLKRIPPRSEALLLSMLLTLTGDVVPPKALADACLAAHMRLRNARFAVPALAALERPRALSLLPKLVPLEAATFKAAMHRLMLTQPVTGEPLLAPQEILTALLALNPKAENLPLKAIMGAINHCFAMRDADMGPAFHSEALASTMQQLVVRSPLPPLFMRFVIQAVTHAPQLRGFVCDTLAALVNKAVWANPQQWKGWIVCVANLVPDSLPVLLQLPLANLEAALKELAPAVTLKAEAFLDSPKCGALPKPTRAAVKQRAAALRQAAAAKDVNAPPAEVGAAGKASAADPAAAVAGGSGREESVSKA